MVCSSGSGSGGGSDGSSCDGGSGVCDVIVQCYGDISFAVSGPSMWNSLPATVRSSDCTVTTFRTQLKTLLFVCLSDYVVTVELLPDSALVALRRFCAIQMAVMIIIIIKIKA